MHVGIYSCSKPETGSRAVSLPALAAACWVVSGTSLCKLGTPPAFLEWLSCQRIQRGPDTSSLQPTGHCLWPPMCSAHLPGPSCPPLCQVAAKSEKGRAKSLCIYTPKYTRDPGLVLLQALQSGHRCQPCQGVVPNLGSFTQWGSWSTHKSWDTRFYFMSVQRWVWSGKSTKLGIVFIHTYTMYTYASIFIQSYSGNVCIMNLHHHLAQLLVPSLCPPQFKGTGCSQFVCSVGLPSELRFSHFNAPIHS